MECKAARLKHSREPSNHSTLPILTTEMVRPVVKPCIIFNGRYADIPVLIVILGANELKVILTLKKKKKKKIPKLNQLTRVKSLLLPDILRALLYNPGLLFSLDYITAIVNPSAVKFL